MEHPGDQPKTRKKPQKSPCAECGKPIAPQGIRMHYWRTHPGLEPGAKSPPGAPADSARADAARAPAKSSLFSGKGGLFE